MPSIRLPESIAKLLKTSNTTLSFPSSTVNIGAMQYKNLTALTLNTSVLGVGGLDASLTASSLYFVYAVMSNNAMAIIGSKNSSLPSGYTIARQVGSFFVNASSQIESAVVGQFDSIMEYTSGAKVSLPNAIKVDSISEYTSGSKVSLPNTLKVSQIEEYSSTNGVHIKGASDGASFPTGYIGETVSMQPNSGGTYAYDGNWHGCGSLSITAGVWFVHYVVHFKNPIIAQFGGCVLRVSDGSSDLSGMYNNGYCTCDVAWGGQVIGSTIYTCTSSKTLSMYFTTCGYDGRWSCIIQNEPGGFGDGRVQQWGSTIFQAARIG
jgi:hypothetical protein